MQSIRTFSETCKRAGRQQWMRAPLIVLLLSSLLGACSNDAPAPKAAAPLDQAFISAETAWRMQRQEELTKPDGWASLVGLHWISLKAHFVGSDAGSGIRLAKGPPKMGLLQQQDGKLFFAPEKGAGLTLDGQPFTARAELHDDASPTPSTIGFDDGRGLMTVITRGGRHALRVKHAEADTRTNFMGLDYWVVDPSWQVTGTFKPHPAGTTIPIVDIIGVTNHVPNPGAVEFVRGGKTFRLEALDEGAGGLFLVFADRTSGHGSYGAGRFLDAPKPGANGRMVLNFNRAYSPPCAFTPFATCPLPPPENRIDLLVNAGEKKYVAASP